MDNEPTPKRGRARVADNKRRKPHSFTMTDDEHAKLLRLANYANQNASEYIISQLKLNKP
jgi:hypothetical protein